MAGLQLWERGINQSEVSNLFLVIVRIPVTGRTEMVFERLLFFAVLLPVVHEPIRAHADQLASTAD